MKYMLAAANSHIRVRAWDQVMMGWREVFWGVSVTTWTVYCQM